ncbi:universal stress protein [Ramlibacter albus]|uniref:Universal stress protein n=1 Tax=Ramlibacter albus TaxID=2079448 RepID=A0A923S3W6_9BURK|nr:universal stress protein [Ramlibacter albus]MBC5766880.1 universal stress protein [Ramlibacter albus]
MYQHILVPLDGSRTASLALGKAAALAKVFKSKVTLATVVDTHAFAHAGAELTIGHREYIAAANANADNMLAQAAADLAKEGVDAATKRVDVHAPHEGIITAANEAGADLIVMGSHGRHGMQKLLLGSVAQRVLTHTTLPVLVVRGE